MSVSVQSDGERLWTDSVTWQLTFAGLSSLSTLEEGLVRWTDPGGQTFTQLLLLLSGALIGVAASLVVERLFAWVAARSARADERPPTRGAGAPTRSAADVREPAAPDAEVTGEGPS